MKKQIINSFWKILISALLSMIAYLALYMIWGAILGEVKNASIQSVLLSTGTSAGYALILMLMTKYRKGVGMDEFLSDYKDRTYISLKDDLNLVWSREKSKIVLLGIIIGSCLILNKFDAIVFGKKIISTITFPFATLCIYSSCFPSIIDFIGYIISFAVISVFYITFVLLYRRKQHKYWHETEQAK